MSVKQKNTKKDWMIGLGIVFGTVMVFGVWSAAVHFVQPSASDKAYQATKSQASVATKEAITADAIYTLVNSERKNAGVPELKKNDLATKAAQQKCDDMVQNNYYEHVNPKTGKHGYDYTIALIPTGTYFNENLTKGPASTNKEVVQAWIDSAPHKATMIEPRFTDTGIAVCQMPNDPTWSHTIVQEFVELKNSVKSASSVSPQSATPSCNMVVTKPGVKYQDASWIEKGQTRTVQGLDGNNMFCNGKSVSVVSPVDTIVYTGTWVRPSVDVVNPNLEPYSSTPPPPTRAQLIRSCIDKMNIVAPGSSAYMNCYNIY